MVNHGCKIPDEVSRAHGYTREILERDGGVPTEVDLMQQVLRPLAERRGLDTWEKIVGFAGDEWFPSRLSFGNFKGRLYQEAREDAELLAWLKWLASSTNVRSCSMGRWYLEQLKNGSGMDDAAFLDLEIQALSEEPPSGSGLVVYHHPELSLYERLVEVARNRLAELELEQEITALQAEAERVAEEARELAGEVPF